MRVSDGYNIWAKDVSGVHARASPGYVVGARMSWSCASCAVCFFVRPACKVSSYIGLVFFGPLPFM